MATEKQKLAAEKIVENGGNVSKTMKEVGYSPETAKTPKTLTQSKGWKQLMKKHLSDKVLAKKHNELLNARRIEHLVFPVKTKEKDIKKLLASVNCTVKKIQHGETAKHVWFWARDNLALKNGLDMAYKLKGKYAPEKKDISLKNPISILLKSIQNENEPLVKKNSSTHSDTKRKGTKEKDKGSGVEIKQSILDKEQSRTKDKV